VREKRKIRILMVVVLAFALGMTLWGAFKPSPMILEL